MDYIYLQDNHFRCKSSQSDSILTDRWRGSPATQNFSVEKFWSGHRLKKFSAENFFPPFESSVLSNCQILTPKDVKIYQNGG